MVGDGWKCQKMLNIPGDRICLLYSFQKDKKGEIHKSYYVKQEILYLLHNFSKTHSFIDSRDSKSNILH